MKIPIFQVDAFTADVFSGNPAAVCPLEAWIDAAKMQAIAAENNLSETAFLVRKRGGYGLRWFTSKHEVQLCGHATLASAFVVFTALDPSAQSVRFDTCSGPLVVSHDGEFLSMDFPALPVLVSGKPPEQLFRGLDPCPPVVLESARNAAEGNYFGVYENEDDVRRMRTDLSLLEQLHPAGVCVTAPGRDSDFVSRYFAPSYGIPEDPVTGSTHCSLAPYWSVRLNKTRLHARQLSPRGGEMFCEPKGDRVMLKGKAVLFLEGTISI
ncbi:MAG: PhzF family phenazine biosynthesis protein [Terriglobales bacterium]